MTEEKKETKPRPPLPTPSTPGQAPATDEPTTAAPPADAPQDEQTSAQPQRPAPQKKKEKKEEEKEEKRDSLGDPVLDNAMQIFDAMWEMHKSLLSAAWNKVKPEGSKPQNENQQQQTPEARADPNDEPISYKPPADTITVQEPVPGAESKEADPKLAESAAVQPSADSQQSEADQQEKLPQLTNPTPKASSEPPTQGVAKLAEANPELQVAAAAFNAVNKSPTADEEDQEKQKTSSTVNN